MQRWHGSHETPFRTFWDEGISTPLMEASASKYIRSTTVWTLTETEREGKVGRESQGSMWVLRDGQVPTTPASPLGGQGISPTLLCFFSPRPSSVVHRTNKYAPG